MHTHTNGLVKEPANKRKRHSKRFKFIRIIIGAHNFCATFSTFCTRSYVIQNIIHRIGLGIFAHIYRIYVRMFACSRSYSIHILVWIDRWIRQQHETVYLITIFVVVKWFFTSDGIQFRIHLVGVCVFSHGLIHTKHTIGYMPTRTQLIHLKLVLIVYVS